MARSDVLRFLRVALRTVYHGYIASLTYIRKKYRNNFYTLHADLTNTHIPMEAISFIFN